TATGLRPRSDETPVTRRIPRTPRCPRVGDHGGILTRGEGIVSGGGRSGDRLGEQQGRSGGAGAGGRGGRGGGGAEGGEGAGLQLLHGFFRAGHRRGRLGNRQSLQEAQLNSLALLGSQASQGRLKRLLIEDAAVGGWRVALGDLGDVVQRVGGVAGASPEI